MNSQPSIWEQITKHNSLNTYRLTSFAVVFSNINILASFISMLFVFFLTKIKNNLYLFAES